MTLEASAKRRPRAPVATAPYVKFIAKIVIDGGDFHISFNASRRSSSGYMH